MRIAFLRHGPTDWNAAGRIQGHTDIPLSAEGAALMTRRLLPSDLVTPRVYVSPLTRARETARALGLDDTRHDRRLMEQHWGHWEGLTRAEILARDGEDAFTHAGLRAEFRPPGGESTAELMARVGHFLSDIAKDNSDAIAVAHLGVLRAAYTLATGWHMETPMPKELDVSRILVLSLDPAGLPAIAELNRDFSSKAPMP